MALEIERKWLIDPSGLPFALDGYPCEHIVQSYLSFSPQVRLRSINHGARCFITIKTDAEDDTTGLVRREFEAEITSASYEELSQQAVGKTLVKTRYYVPVGETAAVGGSGQGASSANGQVFEIDIYEGEFTGLAVAELEFPDRETAETFPSPAWALRDISTDPAFKNVVMAQG